MGEIVSLWMKRHVQGTCIPQMKTDIQERQQNLMFWRAEHAVKCPWHQCRGKMSGYAICQITVTCEGVDPKSYPTVLAH